MPEISVLIPTYNRAGLIGQALDGLCAQTFQDWEAIVVDDGSTDNTREVVCSYGSQVKYVFQPNRGVSAARNRAFTESVGRFILFLDSDDLLLPTALEALRAALAQKPLVGVVHSDGYVVDGMGTRIGALSDYRQGQADDSIESFVLDGGVIGLHSALIRRESLSILSGPFDEEMVGYEDRDLFMRLKAAGCRFRYVPEFTCCYRFHDNNKSAPKSAWAERRRQSLIRNRMKALNAPWFGTLSLSGRCQFFEQLLTSTLAGDYARQEEIIAHDGFGSLPRREKARILYHLAVENMLSGAGAAREWAHLAEVRRLWGLDPRPYLLSALLALPPRMCRDILMAWRKVRSGPVTEDPVTRILRTKGMA